MTDKEVHSALVRWLSAATGQKFIKADQGGDRLSLPYGMVNLTGTAEVRTHAQNVEFSEDEDSERVMARPVIETEWRFSLHAYGEDPTSVLRPIRSAFEMAQAHEPLMPGLVIHEISQIRDVPEMVGERREPRAQMDLMLRGLVRDGVLVDTIETYSFAFEREA